MNWSRNRTGVAAAALGMALAAEPARVSGEDAWPIVGLRVPLALYENGEEKTRLVAGKARAPSSGDIDAQSARIEMLSEQRVVEGWAEAAQCHYSRTGGTVTSEGPVRMERGTLTVTGEGLNLDTGAQVVRILRNVRVEVRGGFGGPAPNQGKKAP